MVKKSDTSKGCKSAMLIEYTNLKGVCPGAKFTQQAAHGFSLRSKRDRKARRMNEKSPMVDTMGHSRLKDKPYKALFLPKSPNCG